MNFTAWLLPSLHDLDHSVVRDLDRSAPIRRDLVRGILTLTLTPGRYLGHEVTPRILVCNGDVAVAVAQLRLLVIHGLNVVGGRVVQYLVGSGLRLQLALSLIHI